jgi:16S rRNA (adenine1518-N6/adenine1519-N6)-dimethyltransferase
MDISGLLFRYGLRPNKSLGQNFLIDEPALRRVVEAADIQPDEVVLEIGPGLGGLTRLLAAIARRVVAVELDEKLIPPLQESLAFCTNVVIVQGDILGLDPAKLMIETGPGQISAYLVVANIPYYITSALVRHLLEASHPPQRLVLTVQREVAERMCAEPGNMSLLSLSVQVYGMPEIVTHIPAGAFYPPPKVDSAVVRVDLHPHPVIPEFLLNDFFLLAKAGFSQKRKTLRNALAGGMHWTPRQAEIVLNAAGIDGMRRAQTLELNEWGKLADLIHSSPSLFGEDSCQDSSHSSGD